MTEPTPGTASPPLAGLIAAGFIVLGVLLWMFVSKGLLFVAGIGAFGPGILRELGWLRDQDEFQRQAAHRAGYHAYLLGGLATILAASALQLPELSSESSAEWVSLLLVVLWGTWFFSALLSYWGTAKTTSRVLTVFGSFWALFVIASLVGEAIGPDSTTDLAQGLLGTLVGIGVVAPFFVLAWTAGRWPRATGIGLLGVCVAFFVVFGGRGGLQWSTTTLTMTLLAGPLLACGVALLREST